MKQTKVRVMVTVVSLLILGIIFSTALLCDSPCENKTTETAMSSITKTEREAAIKAIAEKYPQTDALRLERGVNCAADFWTATDGNATDFITFCTDNYMPTEEKREQLFHNLEHKFEAIYGRYNQVTVDFRMPLDLVGDEITNIDMMFGALDPFAHFSDDMFSSKIAFVVLLNFPQYTLEEKNTLGREWSRLEWGYARLSDRFASRIPASVAQNFSDKLTAAETYISNYNIMMDKLRNDSGEQLFADGMALITHWGLRDEIKSNYADSDGRGLEKQKMIYQVMTRIVDQSIPQEVIADDRYTWNPYSNEVVDDKGNKVNVNEEKNIRYKYLLDNFHATKAMDPYCPAYNSAIKRAFDQQMEVSDKDIEAMFKEFISSEQVRQVAEIIRERLGRDLEPFDIWYDGFKSRSSINEDDLSAQTRRLYPNTQAIKAGLPTVMTKLGFTKEKAKEVCAKIEVDASRGAGHAWGAMAKDDVSRLRTRVGAKGLDYKGYNIAVHEFGHNVEQTITMNDVDSYFMSGVPSTAFTEALAFVFQKRDLQLLGYTGNDPNTFAMHMLDIFWGCYEIMGVSLVDLEVWRWLAENPDATPDQLKAAVIEAAKEIWNRYYAPVLGTEDSPILAVYSHMINYPLYLPNYPYGHIVESQLETYVNGKNLGTEICRIYPVGRLTPDLWMEHAVGEEVSTRPLLDQITVAIQNLRK